MSDDISNENSHDGEEIITEEALWERIPTVAGVERANTYYELSARIYARGQYDEALALAETAKDIYLEVGANDEGLAQAYSAMGYNLNQLKRITEASTAMSKAVEILRDNKSPLALELSITLGEWLFTSKEYAKTIVCMNNCLQEHLIDNDEQGSANDLYLIGLSELELKNFDSALESINRARKFFKEAKDLISVGRCDHKISRALNEKGEYQGATEAAQRALDVFITARDNVRELYARWELGKAQFKLENIIDALENFEKVLDLLLEEDPKDFNFILEVEEKISQILEQNGNEAEARELARRIANVREILKD